MHFPSQLVRRSLRRTRAVSDRQRRYRPVLECLEDRLLLAGGFAQALARTDVTQQALAESYRRRALEAVRKTLAMLRPEERLAFWQEKVLPDAALTPIRNDAEFKRLQDQ